MIKFKKLLSEAHDSDTIRGRDVYNFYYLWHTFLHDPTSAQSPYGKEVTNYYLGQLKAKYIKVFTRLLQKQLQKYVMMNRIDPDFPKIQVNTSSPSELRVLMAKTFRSDMTRRNDVWNMIAEFLENLSKATSSKDIFLWINQLNNAVHNTGRQVLDKLPTFHSELAKAFNHVANVQNIAALKPFVDKDVREIGQQLDETIKLDPAALAQLMTTKPNEPGSMATQIVRPPKPKKKDEKDKKDEPKDAYLRTVGMLQEECLNELEVSKEDRENHIFMSGLKMAVQDKANNRKRKLDGLPQDFIRGYKTIKQDSWWSKANAKLTQWASDLGHSYGDR